MRRARVAVMTLALTMLASLPAVAQDSGAADPARDQIRQTLRAFYFNLARGDWEAMTADILAAKVVAHRPPPAMIVSGGGTAGQRRDLAACTPDASALVDRAAIELDLDWAEVRVPRCGSRTGADRFRLIRFEGRWRFVHVRLEQGSRPPAPAGLSAPGRSR
jgi:hypothetical protein